MRATLPAIRPDVASSASSEAPAPSALLAGKLQDLRRRHVAVALLTGWAIAAVVGIELLALAMFLDWWLELPRIARVFSLIIQGAVLGYILAVSVVRPWWRQPDEDDLALTVEKACPEFRGRMIAAVQLTRPGAVPAGASGSLARALVVETEQLAAPSDFRRIIPTDRLKLFALMAIFIPLLALAGFAAGREVCTELLKRLLLFEVPVPRKTRLVVPEGNRVVGIGDTVLLEVYVHGLRPAHGKVLVNYRNRRTQEFPLEQDRDAPLHFGRLLENVQDSFSYRFVMGDADSGSFEIRAMPRPTVAKMDCEQEYPAYTGLKRTRRELGDLSLLAGSTLYLRGTATKDLERASIRLVGLEHELPLEMNAQNRREWTGWFLVPVKTLSGFQIQMMDTDHMESRDQGVYRVDVLPDKVPVVRLTYPDRKEELITRVATLLLAFEANDDFQIAKVRLKYKTDAADNGAEKTVELDLAGEKPQRLRRRYEWKIAETLPGLPEGSMIEYWIEAEDNNNATGPGLGATDHQLAKVVSDGEKRADLLNRAGDYLGSISDVAADQERLNKILGNIIRAKAGLE
jgi:hypothetical protein